MTTQPADGSDLVDRVPSHYTLFDRRTVLHKAFERLWERGQPPGEAGARTDGAGEAVPGDDRQVRFPRPG